MNIDIVNLLQIKIAFLLAYFPTISLGGYLQAILNKRLGDDTAEYQGFKTLDPAVHFDLFGFFILIFPWQFFDINTNFGFGRRVPINIDNIMGRFKTLRTIFLIFSGSLAFLINTIVIISLFLFAIFLGLKVPALSFAHYSNFVKALSMFAGALVSLNISLFLVYSIIGVVNLIVYSVDEDSFIKRNQWSIILLIFMVAILLSPLLESLLYSLLNLIFG